MRRKRLYEPELEKVVNMKLNFEMQILSLESMVLDADIIRAIRAGKDAMAAMLKETPIEKVYELNDDIKDLMEDAGLFSNALAQPIDPFVVDDDDLLAELEEMIANDALGAPKSKARPEEEVAIISEPTEDAIRQRTEDASRLWTEDDIRQRTEENAIFQQMMDAIMR